MIFITNEIHFFLTLSGISRKADLPTYVPRRKTLPFALEERDLEKVNPEVYREMVIVILTYHLRVPQLGNARRSYSPPAS